MPLVPSSHRRASRHDLPTPRAEHAVRLRELPEPRPHAVGVGGVAGEEAPGRVNEAGVWGGVFGRTKDGRILQRNFGGHRYPRLAHVGDRTGLEMIRTLQDHAIHLGISVYMEHTITALLKDGGRVAGAFGYDRERGYLRAFRAKPIVLPTAGVGRADTITSNSWEDTGDGQALAYHARAELMDLAFVQFSPTG